MRNVFSRVLITLGMLMLLAALGLTGYNLWDSWRAEQESNEIVEEIRQQVELPEIDPEEDDVAENTSVEDSEGNAAAAGDGMVENAAESDEVPLYVQYPEMEMPTAIIDGYRYIGVLNVPKLGLSLPVMDEWDYSRLRKAPCRYSGSVYSRDLVVAGHNYRKHFNKLKSLSSGTRIIFTDMDGNVFRYEIGWTDVIRPTDVTSMVTEDESQPWDMTLFTCTTGGSARYAIRCVLIED